MKLCYKVNCVFQQWLTGIGVCLFIMQIGFLSGWTSPTLARLAAPDSAIPLTPEEISWVASLLNLTRIAGAVLGAVSANYLGSKKSILVTLVIFTISWLLVALANTVEWLYIARLFGGAGFGMTLSILPLYLGEVSMPEIRGALVSLATNGQVIGQIIASVCGSILPVALTAYIYLTCCLVLMIFFYFLPESPHHLVKIDRIEEARKSIIWYRDGNNTDKELEAVQEFVTADKNEEFSKKMRKFKEPAYTKAIFHVITLYTLMQVCGLNSVVFYMEIILIRGKFTLISPANAVIYVNVSGTVAGLISMFLIDKCGRRVLLIISSTGVFLSMISLGSYFLLMDQNVNVQNLQWLPMCSMFLFTISFSLGLLSVPGTILSEIFPASIKCIAACIAGVIGSIMAFLSSKSFQPMVDLMGDAAVFFIYAISAIIVVPYVLFLMPETKGKSLLQIQSELTRKVTS